MFNILITGSSGFIGSSLLEKLKSEGYYVVGVSRKDVDAKIGGNSLTFSMRII